MRIYANKLELSRKKYIRKSPAVLENLTRTPEGRTETGCKT